METAIYIVIGTMSFLSILGIPCIIYGIYDNKRREREEQAATHPTAVAQ
uniref:Uncharacterized protein n=1 Tax=uncultured bacterium contig00023 TaxID=1181512 RepID=A0A806JZD9_9BACT|nr:hypothetical protein [uncultured bacterium contig00023]